MLRRAAVALLLCCFATPGQATARDCIPADGPPPPLAGDERGVALKILRCVRGADAVGAWQLYLLGDSARRDGDVVLSTRLAAQMFTRQADGTLAQRWLLRDRIARDEAGLEPRPGVPVGRQRRHIRAAAPKAALTRTWILRLRAG